MIWGGNISFPKLILDTNALRNKDLITWIITEYHGDVETSPIAYMENRRQLLANGKDVEKLDATLSKAHIKIGIFGKNEAITAAEIMSSNMKVCPTCKKINWADIVIYSSIGCPPTIIVSDDSDLLELSKRVKTPKEVMKLYSRNR